MKIKIETLYILIFFLTISAICRAQKLVPISGSLSEGSFSSCMDEKGNILITGFIQGQSFYQKKSMSIKGDSDFFIFKTDSLKKNQWLFKGGGIIKQKHTITEFGKSIILNSSNDIVVSGNFNGKAIIADSISLKSSGGDDVFLASLNMDGSVNWIKNFGSKGPDRIVDMAVCPKTDRIGITGLLSSPYEFSKRSNDQRRTVTFIAVFSSNGELLFMDDHPVPARGKSLCFDKEGNLYWGLNFDSKISNLNYKSYGIKDCLLKKYNSSGNIEWGISFGSPDWDGIVKLKVNLDGDLLVTGNFKDKLIFGDKSIVSLGDYDIFIAKISKDGKLKRLHSFGGINYNEVLDLAVSDQNEYIISGIYEDFIIDSIYNAIDRDAFIMVLNENLEITGFNPVSGHSQEIINSVYLSGSNCLLSGFFNKTATFGLTKYKSSGREDILCILTEIDNLKFKKLIHDEDAQQFSGKLSIIPNPTNSVVVVDFKGIESFNELRILTSEGKLLEKISKHNFPFKYDFTGYEVGTYILEVIIENNSHKQKLIVN